MSRRGARFVLGPCSRYSHLAASQLPRIERTHRVRVHWLPVAAPRLIAAVHGGRSPFAAPEPCGQYDPACRSRDAARAAHDAALAEAPACGAFGVPSFVVGELFRGNDRLPLPEAYLADNA